MSEKTTKPLASSVAEKLLETAFDPAAVLSDRLFAAAGSNSEKGIVYVNGTGEESRQSYRELLKEASRIAAGLKDADLKPGDHLLLQLEEAQDFIPGFWGSVLAGVIPVPVAVAPTYSHENSALLKLFNAWQLLERSPILASGSA